MPNEIQNQTQETFAMQKKDSTQAQKQRISLDQLVDLAIEKEASDIHFGEDSRIALRVGGQIMFIENIESLDKEESDEMIFEMLKNKEEKDTLQCNREVDFSYTHKSGVSFRVNIFYQRGKLKVVMRMIAKHTPNMDELGVPEEVKKFLPMREGLILLAGPAGSGKSTTIQSMISYVNENFVKHIITIEDPIEYVFEDKKSIFAQREVGKDTFTKTKALNSALREDANIIMVSEINDLKTLESVLTLVETGHLVISSMPTKDAKQTLERMISMYPQDQRNQAQERIVEDMICILAQDLADRIDKPGRIAVYELLIFDSGIRNIIRHGNLSQLKTAIQSGAQEGMISMDTYAYQLAEEGVISQKDADSFNGRE